MTHTELIDCLSNAKDAMIKYTRCFENVENCKKRIEEEKKKIDALGSPIGLLSR